MEATIDTMAKTYVDVVAAISYVVQANEASGGRRTAATVSALEDFSRKWQLFKASCDRAEEVVDAARKRIAPEHAVDMACVTPTAAWGRPAVSVLQLERALQAVQSLAADLRQNPEQTEETEDAVSEPEEVSSPLPGPEEASSLLPSPLEASWPQPSPAEVSWPQPSPAEVSWPQPNPAEVSWPQPNPAEVSSPTLSGGGEPPARTT